MGYKLEKGKISLPVSCLMLLLSGCAASSVTTKESEINDTYIRDSSRNTVIKEVSVVWKDIGQVQYRFKKQGTTAYLPSISPIDKQHAQRAVQQHLVNLRQQIPTLVTNALAKRGVVSPSTNDRIILMLTPVKAEVFALEAAKPGSGLVTMEVKALLRANDANADIWSAKFDVKTWYDRELVAQDSILILVQVLLAELENNKLIKTPNT